MPINKQLTIPFLSQTNSDEQTRWLDALTVAMPQHRICYLNQLSDGQKDNIEIAIVANPDPKDLDSIPNLKWIHNLWAGVEILLKEIPNDSIKIVKMNDPMLATTMSEAVLAWVFYLHRKMPHYQRQQIKKIWQPIETKKVSETTIGILGLGNLGKASAIKLVQQGFKVCGWSRTEVIVEGVSSYFGFENMQEVIKQSDILVVLLPLTLETKNILDEKYLSYLPKKASIINFARSRIINDETLVKLLASGHIGHAVLDVFDEEPLPIESIFWEHPNVTVLPHISAPTNHQTASVIVAENINSYIRTGQIPESIDRLLGY